MTVMWPFTRRGKRRPGAFPPRYDEAVSASRIAVWRIDRSTARVKEASLTLRRQRTLATGNPWGDLLGDREGRKGE